jgi:hypothetical protein
MYKIVNYTEKKFSVRARATHGPKMEGISNPLCPFCNTHLSVDHIQWEGKETGDQRTNMDMKKEQWNNGYEKDN